MNQLYIHIYLFIVGIYTSLYIAYVTKTDLLNSTGNSVQSSVMTYMSVCSVAQPCLTLQAHGLWPCRLLCPWDFPGKNTGAFSSPGYLPDLGIKPESLGLLHWQVDSLPPALPGKPLLQLPGIKYSVSANPCWRSMPFTQFAYKLFFTVYGSLPDYFRFSDIVSISNMGLFQLWSCAFDLPEFTYLVKF